MVVGDEDDSQRECVSAAPVPASRDCQEVLLWSIPTARCYIRLVSIVPSLMGRIIPSAGTIPHPLHLYILLEDQSLSHDLFVYRTCH